MSEPTLLSRLGTLAATTTLDALPPSVAGGVPARVIDIVGLAVSATRLPTSASVLDFAAELGGRPVATAIGAPERTSVPTAAFVNGVLAHSLDFDDTHLPSIVHPSASVVPAALAVAEARDSAGAELLAAVVAGLEITVRLGMAGYRTGDDERVGQSIYFEHGQHATSICGAVGSAAAAARLCALDSEGIAHSMGVACSMASGIIEANRTGGTVKRLHCGWAAQAGVTAAMLVERGITGAPTALEGRFGLFQSLLRDEWSEEPVLDGLGRHWESGTIFYKPYPANHFTHTAIDAALQLRDQGVGPNDVASAHLSVATPTVRTIGEPLELKQRPQSGYQAQFSGPFAVAAALSGGGSGLGLGLDDFTDAAANDPALRELMAKVTVGGSARCDAIYPHQFPAVLRVETVDGREMEVEVLANRGGDLRPLSDRELRTKFEHNTAGLLDPDDAQRTTEAITRLAQAAAGSGAVRAVLEPMRRLDPLPDLLTPPVNATNGSDTVTAFR